MRSTVLFGLLTLLAATDLPAAAPAAAASSGPAADLLRVAAQAPALQAAARRAEAARARVDASGRLPDIEVEGMGSRMVGPMDERATMWEVNVRQPLPRRGERAADRERARAGVSLADAGTALLAGDLAADTALALAEAGGSEARARLLAVQQGRLETALRTIEARLASGGGRLADRLTLQSRIAALQLSIEEERRTAADALADARGRLGLAPDAALPAYAAPAESDIRPDESAAVRLAAARGEEADAMARMARASAQPMTAVGVRFENERRAMGDGNTLGLAFMSEIPFRSRHYARAEVRAAEAERTAARSDAASARYRTAAALARVQRASALAATAQRLSRETVARLDAETEALLRSASAGSPASSTVLELVELLEKSTEAELQVVRADTAVRTARAELWRHLPVTDLATFLPSF